MISREEQDEHAMQSYERSRSAAQRGVFSQQIVPVTVIQKKGYFMCYLSDTYTYAPSSFFLHAVTAQTDNQNSSCQPRLLLPGIL